MARRWFNKRDAGFIVILVALLMVIVLFAFAGLAVDVSRAYVVKGELQKSADAGALAGAGGLYPATSATPLRSLKPDWISASQFATNVVKQNNAANVKLSDSDIVSIETGYWNLKQNPAGMQPPSTIPKYACSVSGTACTPNAVVSTCSAAELCMQQDVPAVRVTVQKAALPNSFAGVSGWNMFSATASAVAARGNPKSAKLGFPFAVTKCMTDYYLSHSLTGQSIRIPSEYLAVPNCHTGNWSSLNITGNADKTDQDLLDGKITADVSVGTNITIQPESSIRANLYSQVAASYIGQVVYVSVVADNMNNNGNSAYDSTVTGFMAFKITGVQATGSTKYIEGTFIGYSTEGDSSRLGGPQGNSVTPPVMIR